MAPATTAAIELPTAHPVSFWVWMPIGLVGTEVGVDLADDPLHLVRQRAAVGVAQHEDLCTLGGGGLEHAEGVLGVGLVAVEEVLGVEEDAQALAAQEPDGVADHGDALVEGRAQRLE